MTPTAILRQDTQSVRAASDIAAVIGEYVRLKRAGGPGRFVGLCPFHPEKTPSFTVNASRQRFKCFGCGASGDVFEFIQRIEGIGFPQAKEALASRAGVTLAEQVLTPEEKREYARRRAAAEPLASDLARDVADWERGLELCFLRRKKSAAAVIKWLLSQDVDPPGDLLVNARHDLATLRSANAASLVATYRESSEAERCRFRQAGKNDREDAERVTKQCVELLTAAEQRKPIYQGIGWEGAWCE